MRYFLALFVLLTLSACDGSVTSPNHTLTPTEIKREIEAAKEGDSDSVKRLAYHYDWAGEKILAEKYFSQCLSLQNSDCLAEQSNRLIAKFMDKGTFEEERIIYLNDAIRFNHEAFVNSKLNNAEEIEGLQAQGRFLLLEKKKLTQNHKL